MTHSPACRKYGLGAEICSHLARSISAGQRWKLLHQGMGVQGGSPCVGSAPHVGILHIWGLSCCPRGLSPTAWGELGAGLASHPAAAGLFLCMGELGALDDEELMASPWEQLIHPSPRGRSGILGEASRPPQPGGGFTGRLHPPRTPRSPAAAPPHCHGNRRGRFPFAPVMLSASVPPHVHRPLLKY